MPKISTTCRACSKEFSYYDTTAHKGLYCSRACKDTHHIVWNKGTKGLTRAWNKGLTGHNYLKHYTKGFHPTLGKSGWKKGTPLMETRIKLSIAKYQGKGKLYKGLTKEAWRREARRIMKVTDPTLDVHHINKDFTDNRPENLQVMTHGQHSTHHNLTENKAAFMHRKPNS
jgi:hypothetical protein